MFGKKWFTLIEVMIVIVILSVWILWAYSVVDHSINFVNATKVKVLAINYAREGIEGVFNIRDTNWRRRSGAWLRDTCWLKIDPFSDDAAVWCEDDIWFGSWSYVLLEKTAVGQNYFSLSGTSTSLDVRDDAMVDDTDKPYLLCKDSDGYIKSCPSGTPVSPKETKTQWLFFREIQGGYLIRKDDDGSAVDDLSTCANWEDNSWDCWNSDFKEKNFCSIVEYQWFAKWRIKLCSVMTNFKP